MATGGNNRVEGSKVLGIQGDEVEIFGRWSGYVLMLRRKHILRGSSQTHTIQIEIHKEMSGSLPIYGYSVGRSLFGQVAMVVGLGRWMTSTQPQCKLLANNPQVSLSRAKIVLGLS